MTFWNRIKSIKIIKTLFVILLTRLLIYKETKKKNYNKKFDETNLNRLLGSGINLGSLTNDSLRKNSYELEAVLVDAVEVECWSGGFLLAVLVVGCDCLVIVDGVDGFVDSLEVNGSVLTWTFLSSTTCFSIFRLYNLKCIDMKKIQGNIRVYLFWCPLFWAYQLRPTLWWIH